LPPVELIQDRETGVKVLALVPRPQFLQPERRTSMVALLAILTPTTAIIVGGIALLLFGSRIPSVMRSLGQGVTEFKKGMKEIENQSEEEEEEKVKVGK
jgi:sec-independent protein translocase protein TatA